MKVQSRWLIAGSVTLLAACAGKPVTEWSRRPASAQDEYAPSGVSGIPGCFWYSDQSRMTDAIRRACLGAAQLIDAPPAGDKLTDEQLRHGIPYKSMDLSKVSPSNAPFGPDKDVHCRMIPHPQSETSLKFRCVRTNAQNQLMDEEGELLRDASGNVYAANALTADAGGKIFLANGAPLLGKDGKQVEGDKLKVKYYRGSLEGRFPEPRYREMFIENFVSRLYWALGVPTDPAYMPRSLTCFGCNADPFGSKQKSLIGGSTSFRYASVRYKYAGARDVYIVRKNPKVPLGLGGNIDFGFDWSEVGAIAQGQRRIDAEVVALAHNLISFHNFAPHQNRLFCRKRSIADNGQCGETMGYVSDIGGALGSHDNNEEGQNARGDYFQFRRAQQGAKNGERKPAIFRGGGCRLTYNMGQISSVSRAGRDAFLQRVRAFAPSEGELVARLDLILSAANIQWMDPAVVDALNKAWGTQQTPDQMKSQVVAQWRDELVQRIREIEAAPCN